MRKATGRRRSPKSSSTVRIPSPAPFTLLSNLGLQPEIGKTKEIGINIKYDGLFVANDALRIKVNVYQNDVTDFIEQTGLVNGQQGQGGLTCTTPFSAASSIRTFRRRASAARNSRGNYDAGDWFLGVAANTQKGEDLTNNRPLVKIYPAQVTTTVGARFWERKVTVAVRWLAVAAKDASDIPPRRRPPLPSHGRLQCRQPLSRLPAERGHNSGVWHRQPVRRVLREVS